MNCLALPSPWLRLLFLSLALCCGCDRQANRTQPLEAKNVSRSTDVEKQRPDWPRQLPGPEGKADSNPNYSAHRSLEEKCAAVLRSQSSYPFNFRLASLDGTTLSKSKYAGRLLIVDLWATWCGPCRREVPHFIRLQNKYRNSGLSIVGINFERGRSDRANSMKVKALARSMGINYPLALGYNTISDQVPNFRGFPTTVFIDGKGKVRLTLVGCHPYQELEAYTRLLLGKSTAAKSGTTPIESAIEPLAPPRIQVNPFAAASGEK